MGGWSSGYQSAGPYRLAICARVNVLLDPGTVYCLVLSSWAGAAGAAAAGGALGGGVVKPQAHVGGTSAACAAAIPAATPNAKADTVTSNFFIISPFFESGLVSQSGHARILAQKRQRLRYQFAPAFGRGRWRETALRLICCNAQLPKHSGITDGQATPCHYFGTPIRTATAFIVLRRTTGTGGSCRKSMRPPRS
jgi:hypothetical protein